MPARVEPALRALLGAAAVAAATLVPGCITRTTQTVIHEDPDLVVALRQRVRWFESVDRGFSHPVTISPARLTNVLAAIDVETREDEERVRQPAVPTEVIFDVGEKLSDALAQADSSQEVVVKALRKERRFGLFHRKYLTSFTAYVEEDVLYVHLGHVDWKIPKREEDRGEIPDPKPGHKQQKFVVKPGLGMRAVGTQSVAARWRDPVFTSSRRLRTGEGGEPVRRIILMEEELPAGEEPLPPVDQIENLTPQVLRALADLEEARREGRVTEAEYQAQRYELLSRGLPESER